MKRKSGSSDLHVNPLSIQIVKCPLKTPSAFGVEKLQPFFPPIEQLFKTEILDNPVNYGLKFNSNIQSITNNILKKPDNFLVISGDDALTLGHILVGGDGVISVIANAFPKRFSTMVDAALNKNLDLATKSIVLQEVNNPYRNPIDGFRFKLDYAIAIGSGKLESGYHFLNKNLLNLIILKFH